MSRAWMGLAVGAASLALLGGLVIWQQVRRLDAHGDRGFLAVECGTPRWPPHRFPLRVSLSPEAIEWSPVLDGAIVRWNAEAARALFVPTPIGARPDVMVTLGYDDPGHGRTRLRWGAGCVVGEATVTVPGAMRRERDRGVAALHELGHVLGLDHDLDVASVMYPAIVSGSHRAISESDLERVRGLTVGLP